MTRRSLTFEQALGIRVMLAILAVVTLPGCGRSDHPTRAVDATPPPLRPMEAVRIEGQSDCIIAHETILSAGPTRRARFVYAGADCGSCAPTLARTLGRLPGVHEVRCSWTVPEAIVEFNPTQLSKQQILGTITGLGLRPTEQP